MYFTADSDFFEDTSISFFDEMGKFVLFLKFQFYPYLWNMK